MLPSVKIIGDSMIRAVNGKKKMTKCCILVHLSRYGALPKPVYTFKAPVCSFLESELKKV